MAWEEVTAGGAVGLLGTLLGVLLAYHLQQRSASRTRQEQQAHVKALLAAEIATNTAQIIGRERLTERMEADGIALGPGKPFLSKSALDTARGDLSLLPPDVAAKVLLCYHNFDVLLHVVERYRNLGHGEPLKESFGAMAEVLQRLTKDFAVSTLTALDAADRVAFLEKVSKEYNDASKTFERLFSEDFKGEEV